jgi:hypothetical protein
MSLAIFDEPITPNVVYTDNQVIVSAPASGEPNFSYLCDIYLSGSSELITRLRTKPGQTPNTGGTFNLSLPLQNYLEYDTAVPKAGISSSVNYRIDSSSREFRFEYGQEYGTSPSSSITQFFLGEAAGDVKVGSFFKGTINQIELNRSSYLKKVAGAVIDTNFGIAATGSTSIGYPLLSNKPTSSGYIRYTSIDDWETVSLFRGKIGAIGDFNTDGGWEYYSSSVSFYSSKFSGSADFSFAEDMDYGGKTLTTGFILSAGVGLKNLKESNILGTLDLNSVLYYDVSFHYRYEAITGSFITEPTRYVNTSYEGPSINGVQPLTTCYDETRFAFINNLGTWDYYSIFNPINKTTRLKRSSFDTPNVNQGSAIGSTIYNGSKRGNTTYYTSNEDRYQITTDPLSQEDADWLTEMIESPSVYIQSGSDFIPVNIGNTRYDWRTNPKGQKIFQYTIEFNYSNNRRSTY